MNDVTGTAPWPRGLSFAAPLQVEDLDRHVPADLQWWCDLANAAAYQFTGCRDTCVLTSHALAGYLRLVGRNPRLVRIEAHTHVKCRCDADCHGRVCTSRVLGWDGDGTRRAAAGPDMWHGHLAVTCGGYLLDPTLDQASTDLAEFTPLTLPLPPGWDTGASIFLADADGNRVTYSKYHRQVGWKSAEDARPSHWQPVTNLMAAVAEDQ